MSGLSMAGLSEALGGLVSRQAINKYENARMLPSSEVIIELGKALGVKFDYFFMDSEVTLSDMAINSDVTVGAKQRARIAGKIQDVLERYSEAEAITGDVRNFTTTFYEMVIGTEEDVRIAAMRLHADWSLDDKPLYPLFDIMEDNGVKVISCDFLPEGINGVFCNACGKPVIALDEKLNSEESRFVAVHELGHGLLKFREGLSPQAKERLCDTFACYVLLPPDRLAGQLGPRREWIHLDEIKMVQARYGLPADRIVYEARLSKIISSYVYKRFLNEAKASADYMALVKESVMNEQKPSRMRQLVLKAYGEAEISESKASVLLNASVIDVHKMPLV